MDDSMFPGPQPGPYGQGAPRPPRRGFFDTLRASGWFRPENRTIGGVCAAISARTGWDLVLVRGVVLVALVFGAPLLAVYGAAWALLPEQRDGRIHAEEFLAGRFDAAQFGAGLLVLLGLTSIFPMSATLSSGSTFSWFASIAALGFIAAVVVLALSGRSRVHEGARASAGQVPPTGPLGSPWSSGAARPGPYGTSAQAGSPWAQSPTPGQGGVPDPGHAQAPGGPAFGPASPAYAAPAPDPRSQRPYAPQPRPQAYVPQSAPLDGWIPPVLVERRSVSRRANLAVTGLVLLAMAATFWAMYRFMKDGSTDGGVMGVRLGLIGGGVCLLIVGVALVVASVRGRGAAWLVALSVIGCLLAMPTALVGASYQSYGSTSGLDFSQGTSYFDWSATTLTADSSGSAQLDLTGAPEGTTTTITVGSSVVDLTISARQDQPVRIVCSSGISDVVAAYWTGSDVPESADWVSKLRTCESADVVARSATWSADNGITIRVESWLNSLYFSEDMAASADGAQSSDEGAANEAQSAGAGAADSRDNGPQSGAASGSTADGSASAHQTAHSATASTTTALFARPLLDADRRLS